MAKRKASQQEAEETVVRHTVREWHPRAPETLPQIERTIDSWDGGLETVLAPERQLDPAYVTKQVDKITRRIKGNRRVVVQETVTEWVEGPAGSGPIAIEEEVVEAREDEDLPSAQVGPLRHESKRPRRRFSLFRRKAKGEPEKRVPVGPADRGGDDYQPQCGALTDDGAQCRNSARSGSRYCASHKGYQPPTAKGLAQRIEGDAWDPDDAITDRQSVATADTRPRVRGAKDTRVKVRKATRRGNRSGRNGRKAR